MKALLVSLGVIFLACGAFGAPDGPPPLPGSGVRSLEAWFSSQGARREGNRDEVLVFQALQSWFEPRAEVHLRDFQDQQDFHSFSSQLWFRIPGKKPGELVVVVPTDGTNHRGLAWAAAWADRALTEGTPVALTFLFTGADRGTDSDAGRGSRTFLQDFFPTVPAAVIYLEADSPSDAVRLTCESGRFPSPFWMVQGLSDALAADGLPARITGSSPSLFRLDLPGRKNVLDPWFQRSVPGIWVTGGPGNGRMVDALVRFTGAQTGGLPGTWDRHYLVFDLGGQKFFWGQETYLMVFLSTAALLYFGYAFLGRRYRGTLRTLGPNLWQWPALLAVLFLALWVGTVLALGLLDVRGGANLWEASALEVWIFKTLTAVTLYLMVFLPFRRSPLSRDPDFYAQGALIVLGIMVLGAAAFELSFSFYFLWALVWAAVLLVAPWRPVKLLALVAGPAWLFKAAYDILGPTPDLAMARWILVSPVAGNFVLAVLFFPFLLQVNSWHFSGRRHQDRNDGLRAGVQLTFWALAALAAAFAVLRIDPLSAPKVPVAIERIDIPARTRALGPRSLPFANGSWTSTVSSSGFLNRTVWTVDFSGPTPPETLVLTLEAEGPLTVYDCTFPVNLAPTGTKALILVGRQPPLPLTVRITLPAETRAQLDIRAQIAGDHPTEIHDRVRLGP